MRKHINFASLTGTPDGDPVQPIEGCFKAVVVAFQIKPWKHKKGASGFATHFSVEFSYQNDKKIREVVLQHPFLHPLEENVSIQKKRGERWLSLVDSLQLNKNEVEKLCQHFYEPITSEKWEGLNSEIEIQSKKRKLFEQVQEQINESYDVLDFLFNCGKGRPCLVEIRDKSKNRTWPDHRFLTKRGFEHLSNPEPKEESKAPVQVSGDAPEDFWGQNES